MSLSRSARVAGFLLVALGLALPAAPGQDREKPPAPGPGIAPAESVVRQLYAVRGASVKDLANVLTLHFQAERTFRAVPDAGSNTLLLSGSKAALEDAIAVLREIDRPARSVRVEVLFLELAAKADGEAGKDAKPLDTADLTGIARDVRAKIRDLQQKGVISSVKTVELSALTGDNAHTQVSENKPYVTGVTAGFGGGGRGGAGPVSRSISFRAVGTSVHVKPSISADGEVTIDMKVEDSTMRAGESGASVGVDEKGAAIPAAEFGTFSLDTRVKVRPGHFVLAEGSKTASKAGQAQTVILVTAGVDETNPKAGK
jgi:Bacterial type II and III secretion system protein/Bacterial type II/III secretion system short domain